MDIGKYFVLTGLAASIAAIIFYLVSLRGSRRALIAGRIFFGLTGLAVIGAFGRLMWLVYSQKYQYNYVFQYSSPDLKFPWTIAATWAGQEGSFLLWAFWTAVIGGLVAWKAGKWEARVMPLYITVLTFLFWILAWLSPYNLLPRGGETGYPMDLPWPPLFGRGLNPSLQNYWMAIHPPTIFFGFAALAIPFCFAVAAMIWKDYGGPEDPKGVNWASRVMPWTLMAVATLGVGLFMGGYWAYETLGWHGFWAWDPVENASLWPWLFSLALSHGLIVQKSRGGMGRTNIFLAVAAWASFLWGTYLTRSGALGNASVHAFSSLASGPLDLLKWMLGLYTLGGILMLVWRWRKIPGRPISDKALSRDTAMVVAVSAMIFAGLFVLVASSWPLLSRLEWMKQVPFFGKFTSKEGVSTSTLVYNWFGSVTAIPTLFLLGVVPFLAWGKTNAEKFLSKVLLPWMLAIAAGFGVVYFVITEMSSGVNPQVPGQLGFNPDTPRMVVVAITTLAIFAALANIIIGAKILRSKAKVTLGGWLAHAGIGLLLFGTIISGVYEKSFNTVIVEGEKAVKTPFGYSLAYAGWNHDELEKQLDHTHDEKTQADLMQKLMARWRAFDHALRIKVIDDREMPGAAHAAEMDEEAASGPSFIAEARIFLNNMNPGGEDPNQAKYMRWPYIHKEWFRDFYIAPANDPERSRPFAKLKEGESAAITYGYGGDPLMTTTYAVRYRRFYMDGNAGTAGTVMRAELEVVSHDGRTAIARPGLRLGPEGPQPVPAKIEGLQGAVQLVGGVDANTKAITAEFEFADAPTKWIIPIQVTNKPMINFVWLGIIVMGLGTLIAMGRRSLEARKGAMIEAREGAGVVDEPGGEGDPSQNVVANVPPAPAEHPAKRKRKPSVAET